MIQSHMILSLSNDNLASLAIPDFNRLKWSNFFLFIFILIGFYMIERKIFFCFFNNQLNNNFDTLKMRV